MDTSVNGLIQQATKLLKTRQYDAAHDLNHHHRVWQNAKIIASNINQPVNQDALKIACYWHDVTVQSHKEKNSDNSADYLEKQMIASKFDPAIIKTTVDAVRYHEYSDTPVNIEGKVLYDADKLDVIEPKRWLAIQKALDDGSMQKEVYDTYVATGSNWIPQLRDKFFFDYTKQLFNQRYSQLSNDPIAQQITSELGINLSELIQG